MNLFLKFLSELKKFGLEHFGIYYSTYPGIVLDTTSDPTKSGRIKILLPTIMGDKIHPGYAEPHLADLAGFQTGAFFPPYVGDVVDVFFENGSINHPRYKGSYWEEGELPEDFLSSYGNVRGWVFLSGHKLLFDDTAGSEKITILHKSGSTMIWNPDGTITVQGVEIDLNGNAGEVLTTITDPVIDLITGAPTTGVPSVKAG